MDKIKKMIGGWYIWRKRISAALACIVVFTTVYAMVLPAITLDQDTADQENGIELDEDSETTEQETALEEAENSEEEAAEEVSEEEYTVEEYTEEDTWDFAEGPITLQWPDELAEAEAVSYSDEDDEEDEIDYTVTATFDEESGLPEDVRLQVAEIKKGTEEYEYYLQSALEAVRKEGGDETAISYARFFDITFITDEGEIEPTGPVNIVIEYEDEKELKAETAEDLSVVHFDQEEQCRQPFEAVVKDIIPGQGRT